MATISTVNAPPRRLVRGERGETEWGAREGVEGGGERLGGRDEGGAQARFLVIRHVRQHRQHLAFSDRMYVPHHRVAELSSLWSRAQRQSKGYPNAVCSSPLQEQRGGNKLNNTA